LIKRRNKFKGLPKALWVNPSRRLGLPGKARLTKKQGFFGGWAEGLNQTEGLGITLSKTPLGFWMHSFGLPGKARNPKHSFGLQAALLPVEPKNRGFLATQALPAEGRLEGRVQSCSSKTPLGFWRVPKNYSFNPLQNPKGFGVTFGSKNPKGFWKG